MRAGGATSRELVVSTPDYVGPLEGLVDRVRIGDIPLAQLDVPGVIRQIVALLAVAGAEAVADGAVWGAWLLDIYVRRLREEAQRMLAAFCPSEVLRLPRKDGVLYIYRGAGEEEDADPRAVLREIRLARERAVVRALAERLEARDVDVFSHRVVDEDLDEATSDDVSSPGPEETNGRGDEEDGVRLGDVAQLLRAAAKTLPDVEWHREEDLRDEILARVRASGVMAFEELRGEPRRTVTAFLALLGLVKEGRVLELAGGGGVLYAGVKVRQLGEDLVVGNPWDRMPDVPMTRGILDDVLAAGETSSAAPRPLPRSVGHTGAGGVLEEQMSKLRERVDALGMKWPVELTKEQPREDLRRAMEQLWTSRGAGVST